MRIKLSRIMMSCLSLGVGGSLLLLLGCVFGGCSSPPSPPRVESALRTDVLTYTSTMFDDPIEAYAYVRNTSPDPIILEPLVNMRFLRGGAGLTIIADLGKKNLTHPLTEAQYTQPLQLEPAQSITIDISSSYISNECYALELYYHRAGDADTTYVMYSDVFYVTEDTFFGSQECPSTSLRMTQTLELLSARFEFSSSKWLAPYCYLHGNHDALGLSSEELPYAFATLERLTPWGTWEVIHPAPEDCGDEVVEPLKLWPPQVVDVWQAEGFDWDQLVPGWYRWHMRYYDAFSIREGEPWLIGDSSWFTEMFYVEE